MKITVITVVKNNAATIRDAVESVLGQKGVDLEYIVLDGQSTDGTLEILQEYGDRIAVLRSEKDRNMYHALNKAVSLATGDVVGLLHSDDFFASDTVLSDITACFESGDVSMVYGDLALVDHDDVSVIRRYWRSSPFKRYKLFWGWMPPHPALYVRRDMYEKYGDFDAEIKIAADYDIILRFFLKEGDRSRYLHRLIVKMRTGGASNNTPVNFMRKMDDDLHIARKNGVGGILTVIIKKLRKLNQIRIPKDIR